MDRRNPPTATSASTLVTLTLTVCGGCAIPDYHMPHGFSSTYFRALQHQNAVKSAVDSTTYRTSPSSAPAPVEAFPGAPGPLYVPQNSEPSPAAWSKFRSALSTPAPTQTHSAADLPPSPSPASSFSPQAVSAGAAISP